MRGINSQSGAITTITVIGLVVLLGAAALAIDLGLGWQSRRNLVTSTDAAALAAAGVYSGGGNGCSIASSYVVLNNPDAAMTACDPAVSGNTGYVTVDAEEQVQTTFGQAIGFGDFDADSSSTAQWGPPSSATGLRPFGLCAEAPPLVAFLASPGVAQTHTISYTKDDPDTCGGNDVPGNWGTLDFNAGENSLAETKDWVTNGYDDEVFAGTPGGSCAAEPFACYQGQTGAPTGASNALNGLKNSGIYFGLPIYDYASGNGANAEFHIIGFVRVRVLDFKFNGAESDRYITLRFEPGVLTGACCNPGGVTSNAAAIAICAVDRNNLSSC